MKINKLYISALIATSMYAQTGQDVFIKNCSVCHANILGVTNSDGYENTYITPAPYVKNLVQKLKEETGSKEKFGKFIINYIKNPDKRKSLYGKKAIKKFGLMPSLNGAISDQEITKLIDFLYNYNEPTKKVEKKVIEKKVSYEEKLFIQNCSVCHANILGVTNNDGYENTYITPAPYVTKLVQKLKEETASKEEFITFIKSYIQNPNKRKSLYGKKAIKKFGLMPSLKGVLSDDDASRLANYLYNYKSK